MLNTVNWEKAILGKDMLDTQKDTYREIQKNISDIENQFNGYQENIKTGGIRFLFFGRDHNFYAINQRNP